MSTDTTSAARSKAVATPANAVVATAPKRNKVLLALLCVQLFVLALVWVLSSRRTEVIQAKRLIPNLDAAKVIGIHIEDENKKIVELRKNEVNKDSGAGWTLTSGGNYPAKAASVSEFIATLVGTKVKMPLATKNTHFAKLGVGDAGYKRKLTLSLEGGQSTVVIVGAPGVDRKTPLRVAGSNKVFAVSGLSPYDIATTASSWIDSAYVTFDKARVKSVRISNTSGLLLFEKMSSGWVLNGVATKGSGSQLNSSAIDSLVTTLSNFTLKEPVAKLSSLNGQEAISYGLDSPLATVDIVIGANESTAASDSERSKVASNEAITSADMLAGKKIRLLIGKKVEDSYYVKREDKEFVVKVGKWTVDDFINKKQSDFFKTKESVKLNNSAQIDDGNATRNKAQQVLRPQAGATKPQL